MPNRSSVAGPPRGYVTAGEWPDGPLADDAPAALVYAQEISRRLRSALEGQNLAAVAREARLARSTLYDIIEGRTWPDVVTLAKLEQLLRVRLWPEEPFG